MNKRSFLAHLILAAVIVGAGAVLVGTWQTGRFSFRAEIEPPDNPPPPPFQPPSPVTVNAPNGGECFVPGAAFTITWTANGVDHVDIYFRPQGTSTGQSLIVSSKTGTTHGWTVPSVTTSSAKVYIEAHYAYERPDIHGFLRRFLFPRAHAHGGVQGTDDSNGPFTINALCSPPTISNVNSSGVTTSGATITWSTNQSATNYVDYGTTTSYGSVAGNGSFVTNHSVGLSGLSSGTTYHYRARSANSLGKQSVSTDRTLTTAIPPSPPSPSPSPTPSPSPSPSPAPSPSPTPGTSTGGSSGGSTKSSSPSLWQRVTGQTGDRTAPQISAVTATPGTSSAVVTWSTNENASSFVDYGTATTYGSSGGLADSVTTHTVTLTGLTPATTYHYRVRSKDSAGNEATSADAQVTTLSAGSLNLPIITDVLINGESVFSREAPGTNTVSLKPGDTMSIKGTATPSATVSIFILSEEEMLYTATADAAGSWSQDIPTTDLSQGEHTIEVATLSSSGEATPRVLLLSFLIESALTEAPGQGGQRNVLYLILAIVVVFIGAAVFFYRRYFGGGGNAEPPEGGGDTIEPMLTVRQDSTPAAGGHLGSSTFIPPTPGSTANPPPPPAPSPSSSSLSAQGPSPAPPPGKPTLPPSLPGQGNSTKPVR